MPIHFRDNQYRGVNAHLHSYLQQHGDWGIFHSIHVVHLSEALQDVLPFESGYVVVPEKSLQILRDDVLSGGVNRSLSISDVGIYKTLHVETAVESSTRQPVTPSASVAIADTFYKPEHVVGIVIYRAEPGGSELGTPITRLELLSPANKPPGTHYPQYLGKRDDTLQSGINLVEIDYLHERRSSISIIPDYPKRAENAFPYVILVNRPHPSIPEGKTDIYGFRVDDPLPTIAIPLSGDDTVVLDFGAVYARTFSSNFLFGLRLVDYATLPEGFDTYDEEDQRRIQARMAEVAQLSASS